MKKLSPIIVVLVMLAFKVSAQTIIPVSGAASHIGKKITTCDKVFDARLIHGTTYLYLGADAPYALLTIVIKSSDRKKFKGKPEIDFKGMDVCVTGKVTGNKAAPKIIVSTPKQFHAIMMDTPIKQTAGFN